jgi:hypothetical protein
MTIPKKKPRLGSQGLRRHDDWMMSIDLKKLALDRGKFPTALWQPKANTTGASLSPRCTLATRGDNFVTA